LVITAEPSGLAHDALFYEDRDDYVASMLDFVRAGLAQSEPVLVAVPEPNLSRLRAAFTADEAGRVRTADMSVAGRNPGRIIATVLTRFVAEHRGRRVRIIGEPIWADRTAVEYPACAEHEALINLALADSPAHILCPYDAQRLTESVLRDALRTHPTIAHGPARWPSPHYADPAAVAASFDRGLVPAPEDAGILRIDHWTGPKEARRFVHDFAESAGLAPDRVDDLRRIVQELAVNTLVHSGGSGLLGVWVEDGHVVVQVQDGGRFTDPLVGRRPPSPPEVGHGLFLVHSLADLVRVHHGCDGTTVRAFVALPN
jgi:anti-sigma regulatory factor (Ser/Thr protein kinase)